jgi:hypothetical protein
MERFVVTHTKNDLWSVSYQAPTLMVHPTEEEALSAAFTLASGSNRAGQRTAVVLEEAHDEVLDAEHKVGGHRSSYPRRRFV